MTAVTPLLTHWSYCSFALSYRYVPSKGFHSNVSSIWRSNNRGCLKMIYCSTLTRYPFLHQHHIDSLAPDFSNSNASAMELLQSCTKPSINKGRMSEISAVLLLKRQTTALYYQTQWNHQTKECVCYMLPNWNPMAYMVFECYVFYGLALSISDFHI